MTAVTNCLYKSIYHVCSYGNSRKKQDWIYYCLAAFGTLALEFRPMCSIKYNSFYGLGEVHYWGLNPLELSAEQAKYAPILLIHGKWHNQGVWFQLAKSFQERQIKNPLFTVNLEKSTDDITYSDCQIIDKKFDEIKQLYKVSDLKIHLCGYSRGGYVAYNFAKMPYGIFRSDVNKIILMGAPLITIDSQLRNCVYQINAQYDLMVSSGVECDYQNEEIDIPTGHLGLPFAEESHLAVIDLIQQPV